MNKGKLIVIDGIDGSGKETQTNELLKSIKCGNKIKAFHFPKYEDNFFGNFLKKCLNGEYGDFVNIDPHIASVLYAVDRFESKVEINKLLNKGFIVLLDRYVSSNQIHQGGKIKNIKKREEFLDWQEKMEYEIFGLPRADIVIYLDIPVNFSEKLLTTSNKKFDSVEKDEKYKKNSRECAVYLAKSNDNWKTVNCVSNGKLRTIKEIHTEIFEICVKNNIIKKYES